MARKFVSVHRSCQLTAGRGTMIIERPEPKVIPPTRPVGFMAKH